MPVEYAGRAFFAIWVGWTMVSFTLFSLHVAPLKPGTMGFQAEVDTVHFMGLAPDRKWLGFVHSRSAGALSRGKWSQQEKHPDDGNVERFDPFGDFIFRYHHRRQVIGEQTNIRVRR